MGVYGVGGRGLPQSGVPVDEPGAVHNLFASTCKHPYKVTKSALHILKSSGGFVGIKLSSQILRMSAPLCNNAVCAPLTFFGSSFVLDREPGRWVGHSQSVRKSVSQAVNLSVTQQVSESVT